MKPSISREKSINSTKSKLSNSNITKYSKNSNNSNLNKTKSQGMITYDKSKCKRFPINLKKEANSPKTIDYSKS